MIEIKFDSNNELVLVQHLKEMFTQNPILLQNIIEPSVNGMISDQNIPNQIKESIKQGVQLTLTPEVIKTALDSVLPDVLNEIGIANTIDDTIKEVCEASSGPMYDRIQEAIEQSIDNEINSSSVEDAINERVDEEMRGIRIDSVIEETVDGLDLEDKIETAIRDHVRGADLEDVINNSISDMVEHNIDPEVIKTTAREIINSKISSVGDTKLIELIQEAIASAPGLKKLIEDQTIPPVLKAADPNKCDTIIIKCKSEATASFMWMLKSLIKDETVYIETVNGVK